MPVQSDAGAVVRTAGPSPRRGSVLVLAGVIVGVMVLTLSMAWISAGGDFNLHAQNLYGTRATLYAQGALREAGLVLGRKLATPEGRDEIAKGSWAGLESAVLQAVAALPPDKATGLQHEYDSVDLAPAAKAMIADGGARLTQVHVALGGFHRIDTSPPGADLTRPEAFYSDPFAVLDKQPVQPSPPDVEGFATLSVTVAFEGPRIFLERHARAQHVVKITSAGAVAREFVFFAWGDTRGHTQDPPMENDLSEGGSLLLFGARDGRIFLRGPYSVATQGYRAPLCYDNATKWGPGGSYPEPSVTPGFLPQGAIDHAAGGPPDTYQWVDCWATMPPPRAGVLELCGPLFLRALIPQNDPQIRPKLWTMIPLPTCAPPDPPLPLGQALLQLGQGLLHGLGNMLLCFLDVGLPIDWLNSCWIAMLYDDPGMKIQPGQWWWLESQDLRLTDGQPDYFSIVGATVPDSQGRVRISPFRGLLTPETVDENEPAKPVEYVHPETLPDRMPMAGDLGLEPKGRYAIFPEGLAESVWNRASMCGNPLCENAYTVSIDRTSVPTDQACSSSRPYAESPGEYTQYRTALGLYWAPQEKADANLALAQDLFSFALAASTAGIGARFSSVGKIWQRVLVGALVGTMLDSAIQAAAAGAWKQTKAGPYGVSDAPAANEYRFPAGFRAPERTAIRRYRTLAEYPGLRAMPAAEYDELYLDGVVLVEDLRHDKPLLYTGRGTIVTDDADDPYLTAPIFATDLQPAEQSAAPELLGSLGHEDLLKGYPEAKEDSDALTIHVRGRYEEPWLKEGGLTFRVAPAFERAFDAEHPAPIHAWVVSHQGVRPENAGQGIRIVGNLVCYYANRRYIAPGSRVEVVYRKTAAGPEPRSVALSPVWSSYSGGAR